VRILLVSANFSPHVGGIERFTEILATGLARRGHDVTVLCCRSGNAPVREDRDGFRVIRIRSSYVLERRVGLPYPIPSLSLLRSMRRQVRSADIVHVQDALYATSRAALSIARRVGTPSVLTQHVAFVPQQRRWLDAVQRGAIATIGRGARLATVVVTLNPAVASWVERTWKVSSPQVLPVGVEHVPATADRETLRRSFGLPQDRFLALFVGRDVPKKGLDFYLAAADPAYELVAVSDRDATGEGITMLPFMSSDRVQDLLACVDAFVLPSEGEGFPLTLQEAFTVGLPVVTTMQPGYEHYLTDTDVLVVERTADSVRCALLRLVASKDLRRRLGNRSLAVAERHFGVQRFVGAYEGVYDEARSRAARS
jgi:glycosyltransferase involved in cell wall biosynthesis